MAALLSEVSTSHSSSDTPERVSACNSDKISSASVTLLHKAMFQRERTKIRNRSETEIALFVFL
jgi:hypothetical protein